MWILILTNLLYLNTGHICVEYDGVPRVCPVPHPAEGVLPPAAAGLQVEHRVRPEAAESDHGAGEGAWLHPAEAGPHQLQGRGERGHVRQSGSHPHSFRRDTVLVGYRKFL